MRFYDDTLPMEHSAFPNDYESHVVDKDDVDIDDDVVDRKNVDGVRLGGPTGSGVCLVEAPDVDDDDRGVQFLLPGSPNGAQSVQFIDASNGAVATDSSLLKTTHIVIHKQTLKGGLVSPLTPLPPPTPATPNARERGFRYQWDQSAFDPVIPVRCKRSNGELHKAKFGSGLL